MKSFKSHLEEKKLTPAEKKKREEIAKAMERENPNMPMDKKMAIATATAKRVAEEYADGDMTKKQLKQAADAAMELHNMIGEMDDLPEWVQSKVTKAADYLDSARDYMKNKNVTEAKATKCGRCGTVHVPPEEGGTCPALSKAENEKRRQKNEADAKDVASKISRYVLTTTGTGTTNAKGQKIVYDPDSSKSTAKK